MMVATRRLERRLTYLLAALAVLTVLTLVSWLAWSDRNQRLLQLERDSRNLTASIAVLIGDRLKRVDSDLVQVRNSLGRSTGSNRPLDLPSHLQWIGADGRLHGNSGPMQPGSAEVNATLAFHRGSTRDILWMGEHQLDAASGRPMMSVSRAVRAQMARLLAQWWACCRWRSWSGSHPKSSLARRARWACLTQRVACSPAGQRCKPPLEGTACAGRAGLTHWLQVRIRR